MEINKIRNDFPILQREMSGHPMIYLDNSATTLKPQPVIDAVVHYYTYLGANAHRGDYEMSAQVDAAFEGARDTAQKFINAKYREEVAFTSGSSEGLNEIALMLIDQVLKDGDGVLTDQAEHASSVLPWFKAKKDLDIEYIPLDEEGKITIDNFKKVLTPNIKVVCVAQISNVLGFEAPIKEMAQLWHENGTIIIVDGAQSAPHMKIDVQDLDVDFFVLSAHKLCGPTGIGIMYGKKKYFDALEPVFYGGESNARFYKDGTVTLKKSPLKFESGTQPIEGAIGMAAAMKYVSSIGFDDIHAHEVALKKHLLEALADCDHVKIYNANARCGIVTFNVYDHGKMIPAQDVASFLNTRGIAVRSGTHCAKLLPEVINAFGTVRASFYIYNTFEEVDALAAGLKEATLEKCINIFF